MIKVLFFAHLSEIANTHSIDVTFTERKSIDAFIKDIANYVPAALIDVLADKSAMVSINQSYATWQSKVNDGDELAFLPPVSGG